MHRIDWVQKFTAANADLLAGSPLDPMPGPGVFRVFIMSTVNTATIEVLPSKHLSPTGGQTNALPLRANAEIRAYDPHWETEVEQGEKVVLDLGGTTGTVYLWATWVALGG